MINRLHPIDLLALLAALNPGINPDSDDAERAVAGAGAILAEVTRIADPGCAESAGDGSLARLLRLILGDSAPQSPEDATEKWPQAALDRIEWWTKLVAEGLGILQRDGGLLEACRARMVEIDNLKSELAGTKKALEQMRHWREEAGKLQCRLDAMKDIYGIPVFAPGPGQPPGEVPNPAAGLTFSAPDFDRHDAMKDRLVLARVKDLCSRQDAALAHALLTEGARRERERLVTLLGGKGFGVYDYREDRDSFAALDVDALRSVVTVPESPATAADAALIPPHSGWIVRLTEARRESREEGARDLQARLHPLFEELIGHLDIPDRNCSCHLSPPCSDCVDFGGLRQSIATFRGALEPKS